MLRFWCIQLLLFVFWCSFDISTHKHNNNWGIFDILIFFWYFWLHMAFYKAQKYYLRYTHADTIWPFIIWKVQVCVNRLLKRILSGLWVKYCRYDGLFIDTYDHTGVISLGWPLHGAYDHMGVIRTSVHQIQMGFHALSGAEPETNTLSTWNIWQLFSVFNHRMFILGFRHLNSHKY